MKAFPLQVVERVRKFPPIIILILGLAFALTLGALDYSMPGGMSFVLWYSLGIAFVAWGAGVWPALLVSAVSAVMMGADEWLNAPRAANFIEVLAWNALSRVILFSAFGWLIAHLTGLTRHLTRRVEEKVGEYRAILATAIDGFVMVDQTGRMIDVNDAFCRMLGYQREELLQKEISQLELQESATEVQNHIARIRAQGSDRFETRHRHKDGRAVDVEVSVSCLPGSSVLITFAREIGERKRGESLLRAQRDMGLRLGATSDLQTALNALLEVATGLEGVDCGGVYLSDLETGDLTLAAYKGVGPQFIRSVSHYAAGSDRVKMVKKGQPIYGSYDQVRGPGASDASEALHGVAIVPMCHEGVVVGCLNLASHQQDSIPAQSRLVLETLAAQTAGAIGRIRAESERHQLEQQILEITDREQARIGQELHDGLCQQLVSLAFDANSLARELARKGDRQTEIASRIARYLDQAITEARQLSRGLFPIRIQAEGLVPALKELAATTRMRFGVNCNTEFRGPLLVNQAMAIHLYRIAQEAVANAVKHAGARAISIRLDSDRKGLQLRVEDNGIGIGPDPAGSARGMGLHIMDYRARSMGGSLQVSRLVTGGTCVDCSIPMQPAAITESKAEFAV